MSSRVGIVKLATAAAFGAPLAGGAGALGVGFMVAFVALEQGIALELGLDIGLQLEVRQLQKLDRLLQLRRDDKALALPEL